MPQITEPTFRIASKRDEYARTKEPHHEEQYLSRGGRLRRTLGRCRPWRRRTCARRRVHRHAFEKPPVIDGKVSPGEWDRAFTTSGLMAPFEHELQESETTMSMGFDDQRLYFLFRCRRGNQEWKLWKHSRFNDDYNFGEPSVEVWVTPPTAVPETYQNIINTYPAVLDVRTSHPAATRRKAGKATGRWANRKTRTTTSSRPPCPSRISVSRGSTTATCGSSCMGRNCLGAKPRSQASWSVTQGFSEIPQHPKVHLMDDEMVAQLTGVSTILSGQYAFQVGVVAPRAGGAEADVELRLHRRPAPGGGDDAWNAGT